MKFNKLVRRAADGLLYVAESVFLVAHGWRPAWNDRSRQLLWWPPDSYSGRAFARVHGHAVNSQRFFSRNPLMRRFGE